MKKTFKSALAVILSVLTVFSLSVFALAADTSSEPRLGNSLKASTKLYSAFSDVVDFDKSTVAMPGLERTAFWDGSVAENMIPQGICAFGDYILITAYDYSKEHNSVIYVVNKTDGALRCVIEMPDNNHSGGIAFDGRTVWVAKSTSKKVKGISRLRIYDAIVTGENYVLEDYDAVIDVENTASFITAYNGSLWVGTFTERGNSSLYEYKISYSVFSVTAEKGAVYTIPSKAQGATFIEKDEDVYLAVTTSYGRILSSNLYVFKLADGKLNMIRRIKAPSMLEEIDFSDGVVYSAFESASTEYCAKPLNKCLNPVDVITVLDPSGLTDGNVSFFENISIMFAKLMMNIRGN